MKRAFTMIEIIISLSLLTIFFGAAGELFRSTVILSSEGPSLSNRSSQIDSVLFQLRKDVWNSSQIAVSKPASADLDSSDEKISWTITPNGNIIRTDSQGQSEEWKKVAEHWSLTADASSLTLHDGNAEIRLPSQILLSRGANP
jgi:prepilin-type N-terminal cleavage/methylation domain-containing protein